MIKKLFWGGFLLLTFIITLPATWWGMSKANFFYSPLYEYIEIAEHIGKYAPRNSQGRSDFESTSKVDRVELFNGIVKAINNHGVGLNQLFYRGVNQQPKKLLTQAEVIHLQDVANLLDKLKLLLIGFMLLWLIVISTLKFKKINLPPGKQLISSLLIILIFLGGLLALDPRRIFNQLHIWVFPNNHQWFFYYEESLMSTMMKAPDLFAYILGIWTTFSAFLAMILIATLLSLLKSQKNM